MNGQGNAMKVVYLGQWARDFDTGNETNIMINF